MAQVNRAEWPRCHPQKNYTLPLIAINSGKRMDRMLTRMLGDATIDDLRIDFFCVSTNLTRAEAKIYRQGSLWKAVRASVSIPGIGPPTIENGEIFVDGGLVDNLPVAADEKILPRTSLRRRRQRASGVQEHAGAKLRRVGLEIVSGNGSIPLPSHPTCRIF